MASGAAGAQGGWHLERRKLPIRVREGSEKGQRRVREGSEKGGAGPGGTKDQGSRFCSHTLIQLIVVTP